MIAARRPGALCALSRPLRGEETFHLKKKKKGKQQQGKTNPESPGFRAARSASPAFLGAGQPGGAVSGAAAPRRDGAGPGGRGVCGAGWRWVPAPGAGK